MAYRCLECGHIFEEGEQARWSESRGEFWGVACSENMSGCPLCKGDYEETTPCKICGSEHLENELSGDVCDECIEKYHHDIDVCFKVGANDTETIEINCFLASMFDKEQIEELLLNALKEKREYMRDYVDKDCEKFVNSDRSWFAENLAKEVNNL
jgi:hypothetical protein